MSLSNVQTINIRIKTNEVLKVIFLIAAVFLALRLTETLLSLFIAFIIMAAMKPAALALNKRLRIPQGLAMATVTISVLVIFFGVIYFVSRPLATEIARFAESAPQLSKNIVDWLSTIPYIHASFDQAQLTEFFNSFFRNIADQYNSIANALGSLIIQALQGIVLSLFVLFFAIYLFLEQDELKTFIIRVFKLDEKKFTMRYDAVESQLGAWVRGQLLLCFSVGLATYIGLLILGVQYALPLAILAGLLEIVPIIGPIVTGVIVSLVGLTISPLIGVLCVGLSVIVQQLENNFLVPVIMKRAVGLSPVLTIVSILVGQELFGIVGAIIAVPSAAMIAVLVDAYLNERDDKSKLFLKKKTA
jgi:predicted PurR-regulated permease PerM